MALSDEQIQKALASITHEASVRVPMGWRRFARAIEAEARKADTELIRQMLDALVDLVEAGEDAWGDERPCVRIGKEEIAAAARARLEC